MVGGGRVNGGDLGSSGRSVGVGEGERSVDEGADSNSDCLGGESAAGRNVELDIDIC